MQATQMVGSPHPQALNQIGLQPWNLQSPFDHVGAIIPNWGCWTLSEELELQLTQFELERFHDVQYGHDVRLLDLQGKASTILHPYANALGPCPCGCRSTAFHEITLRRGASEDFMSSPERQDCHDTCIQKKLVFCWAYQIRLNIPMTCVQVWHSLDLWLRQSKPCGSMDISNRTTH